MTFLRKALEELGAVAEREALIQTEPRRPVRAADQLAVAQAKQLGSLSTVKADPNFAQGFERRPVTATTPARPFGDSPSLSALPSEQDDDFARLAQRVGAKDEGIGSDGRHGRRTVSPAARKVAQAWGLGQKGLLEQSDSRTSRLG